MSLLAPYLRPWNQEEGHHDVQEQLLPKEAADLVGDLPSAPPPILTRASSSGQRDTTPTINPTFAGNPHSSFGYPTPSPTATSPTPARPNTFASFFSRMGIGSSADASTSKRQPDATQAEVQQRFSPSQ